MSEAQTNPTRVLYCHCRYTNVLPKDVKAEVLSRLSAAGRPFKAVADLCELSARKDDSLKRLAADGQSVIAACYPRVVRELFRQGGAPIEKDGATILNMRTQSAGEICEALEV